MADSGVPVPIETPESLRSRAAALRKKADEARKSGGSDAYSKASAYEEDARKYEKMAADIETRGKSSVVSAGVPVAPKTPAPKPAAAPVKGDATAAKASGPVPQPKLSQGRGSSPDSRLADHSRCGAARHHNGHGCPWIRRTSGRNL